MFALLLLWQAASVPPSSDFDRALECRAYSAVLPSLVDPTVGTRIREYWIKKSAALGKKQGMSTDQVTASTLVIPIKSDHAVDILLRCVDATPKSASGLK